MQDRIKKLIREALKSLNVDERSVELEHPDNISHGDFSTSIALSHAKGLGISPRELAEEILRYIVVNKPEEIEKVEAAGAGFINFYLSRQFFAAKIAEIFADKNFGKNTTLAGQKVMVEYTDPNPFKEFHIGHLMSNAIGESVARLIEFAGAKVLRACWQGDVGLHVAKAMWGAKKNQKSKGKSQDLNVKEWGEAYAAGSEAYETDEAAKKEINALNKKIFEKSDRQVNNLYHAGRAASLAHFEEVYKKLGTRFDYYFFESLEGLEGKAIVEEALGRGIFEKSDGAVVYRGDKHGLHTRVFINSEGLPTYEAKELGLNRAKFEKEPDLSQSIIVTANEQSEYFKVVFSAIREIFPKIAEKTKHVAHGMLRFASGKMSSRVGNVITGESLIAAVETMVHKKLEERELETAEKNKIAETVAIGAIKYSVLRQTLGSDIIFDFEKSISFEGDSGPYLQYSYVRAKSVLAKAEKEKIKPAAAEPPRETSPLEKLLARFPEVVLRAGAEYAPHYVAAYLIELAGAFNNYYAHNKIVNASDPTSGYRVALTGAFAAVMKNGLYLLGINAPEKM